MIAALMESLLLATSSGADTKVASNQWHTPDLRAEASRFAVKLWRQGDALCRGYNIRRRRTVARWTKADSVTHFDTLMIRPPP